jgi:succinate dehydrogenase/fumarate reductase flavoprotein subunit
MDYVRVSDEEPGMNVDCDVVVCGFGGAGAAAAIAAHDSGARVLVLEKAPTGGGSTAESGGSFATILDQDGAVEHYLAITEGRTPRAVLQAYVSEMIELPGWLEDNGATFEVLPMRMPPFPRRYAGTAYRNMSHADAIGDRVRVFEKGVTHGGTSLWNFLRGNVAKRNIEVRLGTKVVGLIMDGAAVAGVEIETVDGIERIGARRGVVLTTGGFAYAPDLLSEHVGVQIPAYGPPGRNTGDGIALAQQAGAGLWHMNAIASGFGYLVPGIEAAWMCSLPSFGFFMVDGNGRRFLHETSVEHHAAGHALIVRDFHTGEFTRLPSYLIFDEVTRQAGPISTNEAGANRMLEWSETNLDEIAKGWIKRGDTMAELASELGIPSADLAESAARFNTGVGTGDEFGRPASELAPVATPPYYGIAVWPSLFNTQGGPRRDEQARVINVYGRPIPGLFSAGELGSIWGALYPGAGNVTETMAFGRIAGRAAAARIERLGQLKRR